MPNSNQPIGKKSMNYFLMNLMQTIDYTRSYYYFSSIEVHLIIIFSNPRQFFLVNRRSTLSEILTRKVGKPYHEINILNH